MATPERVEVSGEELLRAARILAVRSRRESTGLFTGNYLSAFRGGGLEFEESRPYVPGDDVRTIDWNATARNDELFVKRFREERDQTLLFALDVSASMRFGTAGRAKASTAAHALSLMAAAAGPAVVADSGQRYWPIYGSIRFRSPIASSRRRRSGRWLLRRFRQCC